MTHTDTTTKSRRQARNAAGRLFDPENAVACLMAAQQAAYADAAQAAHDEIPATEARYNKLAVMIEALINEHIDYTYRTHVVVLAEIPFPITPENRPTGR